MRSILPVAVLFLVATPLAAETVTLSPSAGCGPNGIFEETANRLRPGDELVITRIDRLARSMMDLQSIAATLKERGVALKATEQAVDTSSSAGKAFFDMLGVFAEFETNLRRERQMEGTAKAQAEGKYRGRKQSVDGNKV